MGLHYENLDGETRRYMLHEYEGDLTAGKLFLSSRLTDPGKEKYKILLKQAIEYHDDDWLEDQLNREGCFKEKEERNVKGKIIVADVPETAAVTLAEGEFNRFYIRGLCQRALKSSISRLIIYRAKPVSNPRPESQARIGAQIEAAPLLQDLREKPGIEPALGLPPGPNSGLSVKLPQ